MAGAAIYFTLPRAPAPWLGALMVLAGAGGGFAALAWIGRERWARPARAVLFCGFVALACIGLAFSAGMLRERLVAAPKIAATTQPVIVEGGAADLDQGSKRPRLTQLRRNRSR